MNFVLTVELAEILVEIDKKLKSNNADIQNEG